MTRSADATLLHLCQEARQLLDPKLDADAIEQRVLAHVQHSKLDSGVLPRKGGAFTRWQIYAWPVAFAAAAALALVWLKAPDPRTAEQAPMVRGMLTQEAGLDGNAIELGEVLEADTQSLTIRHAGIATWRLSAPGRVRILERGARITVSLEQGRIEAEVVPQSQPEVFAVEIERTRVAVHGTVFSVERRDDKAAIAVSEGSVRLGTSDQRGSTQGQILSAPARTEVTVLRLEAEPPEVTPSRNAKARVRLQPKPWTRDASAASAQTAIVAPSAPDPDLPEVPSAAEIEHLWESINREVSQCFAEQPAGEPNVRVSVNTRISVVLAPDGTVAITNCEPPLSEPIQQCISQQLTTFRAQKSKLGAFMRREKMLLR
ncbi:MAG: FecR family protein [Myxococcales bacterium]